MCSAVRQVSAEAQTSVFRLLPSPDALVVERAPLFSGILSTDYAAIAAVARAKVFARGEMLFFKGDAVQQIVLLTSGCVKITQFGLGGSEVILSLRVPGEVLGAVGLLSTGKHYTTAQAFRLCRALVWDARTFKALVDRLPILHQNMARILGEDMVELEERFQEIATEKVSSRVARQLVRLREKIGHPVNNAIEVCMSRQELAQMTGTTLFTVSRLLSAWEALGIVKASREAVTICDVEMLRSVSAEA